MIERIGNNKVLLNIHIFSVVVLTVTPNHNADKLRVPHENQVCQNL